jgi:phosphoribosyl-AMP cyclohydrolase
LANFFARQVIFVSSFHSENSNANSGSMDAAPDFGRGTNGLLPAIAQDATSGDVLMLAWMNAESYAETLRTGRAVYFSRSRERLWYKGEESGHEQIVQSIFVDCDADTILLKVEQLGGAACHEGYHSCFFRQVTKSGLQVIAERVFDPATVYQKPHA